MTKSILLVGVGGQGTITAAKLLTTGLLEAGCDVKMSEIHGMSQRGGTVSSHIFDNNSQKDHIRHFRIAQFSCFCRSIYCKNFITYLLQFIHDIFWICSSSSKHRLTINLICTGYNRAFRLYIINPAQRFHLFK